MTTPRGRGGHHLYYSSHADPMENMLRAHTLKVLMIIIIMIRMIMIILKSKSSYNIHQQQWPAVQGPGQTSNNKFGSR